MSFRVLAELVSILMESSYSTLLSQPSGQFGRIDSLPLDIKWLSEILSSEGLIIPVLPCERRFGPQLNHYLHRKEYPSFHLPVDRRTKILLTLADKLADSLWDNMLRQKYRAQVGRLCRDRGE